MCIPLDFIDFFRHEKPSKKPSSKYPPVKPVALIFQVDPDFFLWFEQTFRERRAKIRCIVFLKRTYFEARSTLANYFRLKSALVCPCMRRTPLMNTQNIFFYPCDDSRFFFLCATLLGSAHNHEQRHKFHFYTSV